MPPAVVTYDAMLTYPVPDFSAEYAATVVVEEAADSYSAGRVEVVERATGKPLLRVEGHALPLERYRCSGAVNRCRLSCSTATFA